jgi:hypothetical protein
MGDVPNFYEIVLQSAIIHKEWTAEDHAHYLESECFHLELPDHRELVQEIMEWMSSNTFLRAYDSIVG